MSIVRVALAQMSWTGDRESTMDRLERAVRDAAGLGAGLVGFPELCTTPYFCAERDRAGRFEPIPDGPTTRRMRALAGELGVVLVVPLAERDALGARYNSAAVLDADGTVAGIYRKRHLPHGPGCWERAHFRPGSGPAVFATAAGRIGVAICWDRYFPDTWQALARDRAQLTVVPVASSLDPTDRRATLVQPTVAFLHSMFVATVNRVDTPHYTGGSYVADPSGEILGPFGSNKAELLVRDIDLNHTEASREALLA